MNSMKKTYIKPENVIVELRSSESVLTISGGVGLEGTSTGGGTGGNVDPSEGGDAREFIDIPDVWEEW